MSSASADVVDRLSQLQGLIKRDPDAYAEEFGLQLRNFEAELEIFRMQPVSDSRRFRELIGFLSHVAPCYPKRMAGFPGQLMSLVRDHHSVLRADLRKTLVQCIMLLRNRNMVEGVPMLKLFFELFRCQDKVLRQLLFAHIVTDIKNTNEKRTNQKVNREMQNFMYSMLKDENETAARKSLDVMVALYRKRVWTDARTVNVIATACTSGTPKIMVPAMSFFLGVVMEDEEDSDDEEEKLRESGPSRHAKKTKKNLARADKTIAKIKKSKRKEDIIHTTFPAIQLLHDPQGLAERMLRMVKAAKQRFDVRLIMMNLISRIIGQHKLLLLPFYSFVQRYMTAYQQNVAQIMAYLAQACHELVPPNELVPVVKAIANNFVVDRVPPEAIQVGLNGLREVLSRTPLVLEEDGMGALIKDLVAYRKFRNKGVSVAARSLMNLVRAQYPTLLTRRDRGKEHNPEARPTSYGQLKVSSNVDGVELLIDDLATRLVRGEVGSDEEEDAWDMKKHRALGSDSDDDDYDDYVEAVAELLSDDEGSDDGSDSEHGGESKGDDASASTGANDDDDGDNGGDSDQDEADDVGDEDDSGEDEDDGDDDDAADATGAGAGAGAGASKAATKGPAMTLEEALKIARQRILNRVLTPKDFARIQLLKGKMAEQPSKKRRRGGVDKTEGDDDGVTREDAVVEVDVEDLEGSAARKRRRAMERLEEAKAEQLQWQMKRRGGGTTNKEKVRKKNFLMLRKSRDVQEKVKRSLKDQARTLRKHRKTTEKMGKRLKRRRR